MHKYGFLSGSHLWNWDFMIVAKTPLSTKNVVIKFSLAFNMEASPECLHRSFHSGPTMMLPGDLYLRHPSSPATYHLWLLALSLWGKRGFILIESPSKLSLAYGNLGFTFHLCLKHNWIIFCIMGTWFPPINESYQEFVIYSNSVLSGNNFQDILKG